MNHAHQSDAAYIAMALASVGAIVAGLAGLDAAGALPGLFNAVASIVAGLS